jgi:DNA-binding transcriptional regulator YdaS (Cro superfamily)
MDLKAFLKSLPADEDRAGFAVRCGTTIGHLRNVMYGQRKCSAKLAVAIERESIKKVTRRELCPRTWSNFWPELAQRRQAPRPTPEVREA